jgi:two-component system phosphate regulon sensor histidine kinase PhoR
MALKNKDYHFKAFVISHDEIGRMVETINEVAEEMAQRTRAFETRESQFISVLNNMVSGILMLDKNGRIILTNPYMEELLHAGIGGLPGRHYLELERNYGLNVLISKSLEQQRKFAGEVRLFYPREKVMEIHTAPIFNAGGKMEGLVVILHDITEVRKLEGLRRDFVANVSHELKTPITAISGFAETLLEEEADQDKALRQSFLTIILNESRRLNRLVNDLLELSKIESRQVETKLADVNLGQVAALAIETLRHQAENKGVELTKAGDVSIKTDPDAIRQILLNLLSNAITYTPPKGHVTVEIKREPEAVKLIVSDTGIGIPKADMERIFERFYRVNKDRSRQSGGTGLGLAIVKHLVEQLNGQVTVESELGKGTVFTVSFPDTFKS